MTPKWIHWPELFKLPRMDKFDAVCVGRWIIVKYELKFIAPQLYKHEMKHQEQMDKYGVVGFYLRYIYYSLRNLNGGLDASYANNPLEIEARASENT